jgi:hypothetical protein
MTRTKGGIGWVLRIARVWLQKKGEIPSDHGFCVHGQYSLCAFGALQGGFAAEYFFHAVSAVHLRDIRSKGSFGTGSGLWALESVKQSVSHVVCKHLLSTCFVLEAIPGGQRIKILVV